MSGNQHLVSGSAILVLSYVGIRCVLTRCEIEPVLNVTHFISAQFADIPVWTLPICLFLFMLGLLVPDTDSPVSTLGRYIHIPVEHRTWLHTAWFLGLFVLAGFACIFHAAFYWLSYGIFLHLFMDSFSKCGVCWFYPISQYRHFGSNGAKVKKNHKIVLYKNETQAWVLCTILVMCAIFACVTCRNILIPYAEFFHT